MPKAKTNRVKNRLDVVEGLLLQHFTDAMVVRACAKEFDCSPHTVKGYIQEVRERWAKEAEEQRPYAKAAAINRAMRLARELKNNPSEVLKVEKFLAELEGTKEPLQVKQETSIDLDSHAHEAISAFAGALGVSLDKLELDPRTASDDSKTR